MKKKTVRMFILIVALEIVCLCGVVFSQTTQGNPHFSSGFSGSQLVDPLRLNQQLVCLGLPAGDYTETFMWDGFSRSTLDRHGRLHVKAKGTFTWAIYTYAENIPPDSSEHVPLYRGTVDVDLNRFIDPYSPGSTWTYDVSSIRVTSPTSEIILYSSSPFVSTILTLGFSANSVGQPSGGGGGGGGQPVCSTPN